MKKLFLITGLILIILGCQKTQQDQQLVDKWNGYESFYKMGEMVKTLKAGKHLNVGTVTYGIDDDANFYVTYQTTGDWVMLETHLYAGARSGLPLNKPGNPKIGRFPFKKDHGSGVTTYTYRIPLTNLPPAEEPGFIVASHAAVYNANKCSGRYETAWGAWDHRFACRSWGGYSIYYYNEPPNLHTYLYGTEYRNDSLSIYLIDATNGDSQRVLAEAVGTIPSGTYDGAAWDATSGNLFYTTYPENELWINTMDTSQTVSFLSGTLDGTAQSATFYDGKFYYVDETTNSIVAVSFDSDWKITSDTVVSTIPDAILVKDIAISPDGGTMYMVGTYNTNTQLISLVIASDTYTVINITLNEDAQIAYGADDVLYAVSTVGTGSLVSSLDPTSGTAIQIGDTEIGGGGVVISDIGKGPIQ